MKPTEIIRKSALKTKTVNAPRKKVEYEDIKYKEVQDKIRQRRVRRTCKNNRQRLQNPELLEV